MTTRWTNEPYDDHLFEIESPLYHIEGNKVKINHECVNGHITNITPLDVKNKKSDCSQWSGAKYSLQSFNEVLKAQGSIYVCTEYNTGKKLCAFLCPKCNQTWIESGKFNENKCNDIEHMLDDMFLQQPKIQGAQILQRHTRPDND